MSRKFLLIPSFAATLVVGAVLAETYCKRCTVKEFCVGAEPFAYCLEVEECERIRCPSEPAPGP